MEYGQIPDRIVQELVPGKEITIAHLIASPDMTLYEKLGFRPTGEVDENGEPIMETIYALGDDTGRFVLSEEGGLIPVTDPKEELPIGIFDFANYDGMARLDDTRFLPVDKNGNLWYGDGKLVQGCVERSNADLADELTKVIEAQRAYGAALKMVITSDEIESTINNLRN